MSERKRCVAIYPGSFDPVTKGHEDIVRRALSFSDSVIVAVAHTATQRKQGLFDVDERVEMIRHVFRDEPRIVPAEFTGLLVDFARAQGASIIVRGLRAVSDFEYEFQIAQMNRSISQEVETLFMMTSVPYSYLSSSIVKEVSSLNGPVDGLVPPLVKQALANKFSSKHP